MLASLNGATASGWVRFAKEIEQAGADALELNTYSLATDPARPARPSRRELVQLVRQVKAATKLPVAVKLSPQYTSIPHLARNSISAGADALVLFNRFYQPDFDLENLDVSPKLDPEPAGGVVAALALGGHSLWRCTARDLAVTGGVHSGQDVLKSVMAGAQVAMTVSSLLVPGRLTSDRDPGRPAAMDGRTRIRIHPADARQSEPPRCTRIRPPFERGNYIKTLQQLYPASSHL